MTATAAKPRVINNQDAFLAMLRKSKEIGWPTIYKTDITEHDRRRVGAFAEGLRFVWLLRDSGSWLIIPPWASGMDIHDWRRRGDGSIIEYCIKAEPHHRAFLWDGEELREVKLDEASAALIDLAPDDWVGRPKYNPKAWIF